METFAVKNLTFTYPGKNEPALDDVSFRVNIGEFIAVCGQSGSGKSTLLRSLKPVLAPYGEKSGEILFYGQPVEALDQAVQAARIGYVLQNPDSQIVTDKVWHELAFGLESLGIDSKTIRLRVAEMASFFGIQTWFHKDVDKLSGGQKQLLNLASVMAMQPDVLILDEPTSQLDPIAAGDFLETVRKINRELGTTVIITEHRLEEVLAMADRAVVLDRGKVIADDTPANVGAILAMKNHPMFMAMPTPLQAYSLLYQDDIGRDLPCPVNVREGRNWLTALLSGRELPRTSLPVHEEEESDTEPVIEMKEVWFRYGRQDDDVIKDLSFKVYPGELFCIVGGNGTGKSTTLSLASGIRKPYRGKVKLKGSCGMLPQNPQSIFVEKTVRLDLLEIFEGRSMQSAEALVRVEEMARLVEIEHLLDMHPYDLSGGEQQRAALAKVLLLEPEILFLDEPTKGLDSSFKFRLAGILKELQAKGMTIVMVSHDVEFCGRYGDRCAMFFDGRIITTNTPRMFFSGNSFYTTAANRMSRHIFENAVIVEDLVELVRECVSGGVALSGDIDGGIPEAKTVGHAETLPGGNAPPAGGTGGMSEIKTVGNALQPAGGETAFEGAECTAEAPQVGNAYRFQKKDMGQGHRLPRGVIDAGMICLAAATVFAGFFLMDNKHTFVVSFLLVIYAMVPFFVSFERRSPKAREIVILAVLIAAAVVGRGAFIMLPSFKPILAIVIISAVSLGREAGFLVGALSAFVSNFLFGQGPWTPWQMIALGVCGYLAGVIFHRYGDDVKKLPVMIFGAIAAFVIYAAVVDIWTILFMTSEPTLEIILTVYGSALPMNLTHTAATVIFLFLLLKPITGKLERVKNKYGMDVYRKV